MRMKFTHSFMVDHTLTPYQIAIPRSVSPASTRKVNAFGWVRIAKMMFSSLVNLKSGIFIMLPFLMGITKYAYR